tara:strand:+ start:552 stop:989 length:438 start_codon:yes stop_codon:yes gene_type:complete
MGIHWQFGVVQNASAAAAALAGSLDLGSYQNRADHSDVASGSLVTFTTLSGALRADVVPSGGSGSYTFSWTITKTNENSDTGSRFSVNSTGATNTSTFQPTIDGARGPIAGQAFDADFEAECVIGDGSSTVTVSSIAFQVIAVAF